MCRSDTYPVQCRGAKSFVDDLGLSRGVVLSRAAASLRSIETKPFDSGICPLLDGPILDDVDRSVRALARSPGRPAALSGLGRHFLFIFFPKIPSDDT